MTGRESSGTSVLLRARSSSGQSTGLRSRVGKKLTAADDRAIREERVAGKPATQIATAFIIPHASRVVVWKYAHRNVWLDVEDLEQEASLAVLEAARRRETTGHPYSESGEAFMVALALSRLVAEARVPVIIPKYRGDTWDAATAARSVSLFAMGTDGAETAEERRELAQVAVDSQQPMEDQLDSARALLAIHRMMSEESEAARAVLLGDEKPASVAKRMGLAVAKVYADTARAMRNLRAAMCPQLVKG